MKTIIMTVGTSLLTNRDLDLENKRPWIGKQSIGSKEQAIQWMEQVDMSLISAETNTLNRLNIQLNDCIHLLRSDTDSGRECAEVIKLFLRNSLGQEKVNIHKLPGLNYDISNSDTSLGQMAELLRRLIGEVQGEVILAATGGFKAQAMVMAIIGNQLGIPVCYIHEEFQGLIYLPNLTESGVVIRPSQIANLPESGIPRDQVLQFRSDQQEPNRPPQWQKVKEMLLTVHWIDRVFYDERAYNAPKNGVKGARDRTRDGRNVLWMHLSHKDKAMAIAIETTGRSDEELSASVDELSERLGRLF